MRDLLENASPKSAVEAVRRAMRPILRRRLYVQAGASPADGGYAVRLDDKPARTPGGRLLAAPTLSLAQAIAAEWQAQREVIDPGKMPLTRLANTIIDGVCARGGPVAAEVHKYLGSDLVCYRARSPQALVERQARAWDPILEWASEALGARFRVGEGVTHIAQPESALVAARAIVPDHSWRLGAIHSLTTLTGSALIALALWRGGISVEDAWRAAHVDEDWNMEQWGKDELALERRALRFTEFEAAATVLRLL